MTLIPVPNPTLDAAGFKSPRPTDDISPDSALMVQKIMANLRVGAGALVVGNLASPMPIDQYLAAGGSHAEPVYCQFQTLTSSDMVSARAMADAFNGGTVGGCSVAYGAFDGIPADKIESHLMDLFPDLRNAFYKAVEVIASKGL